MRTHNHYNCLIALAQEAALAHLEEASRIVAHQFHHAFYREYPHVHQLEHRYKRELQHGHSAGRTSTAALLL